MGVIASQITSLTMIVYSNVYSDADQRKNQSSASLAFVWGIHRGPVNSSHKWPVSWKMFPFDDVIMTINFLTPRRCDTDFAKPICTPCWKRGAAFDPLHIDSLWANDAIWRQSSGSTLAQVIARCLKTPSHYLNQCRLIITRVLWRSLKSNSTRRAHEFNPWHVFNSYTFKITVISPGDQRVKRACA